MDKPPKKFQKPPSNTVYVIDGASYGTDDALVEAIQASVRARLQQGTLAIPRLPETASRILQLSQDPDVEMNEITRVIVTDPVLAARLLIVANSAAYSAGARVEGLDAALSRLGMKTICNIVFTESVQTKVFSAKSYRELLEESWRLSLASAVACEVLSRKTGVERESAYLLGLLHETGKPTLVNAVTEYERKNQGRALGQDIVEILLSQLHEEIGAHVLGQWEMPPAIVSAAGAHHRYSGATHAQPAQQLIHAANLICQHLGVGAEQRDIDFNLQRVFVDLGLAEIDTVNEILESVQSQLNELMSSFGGSGAPGADRAA